MHAEEHPAAPEEEAAPVEEAAPEEQAAATPEPEREATPARVTAEPRGQPIAVPVQDSLTLEVDLLRRAQQARAAGEGQEALRLLSEHQRRFPRGSLRMEREVSRILVFCESGQRRRGVALAERFLSRHASSPAAARVRGACGLAE